MTQQVTPTPVAASPVDVAAIRERHHGDESEHTRWDEPRDLAEKAHADRAALLGVVDAADRFREQVAEEVGAYQDADGHGRHYEDCETVLRMARCLREESHRLIDDTVNLRERLAKAEARADQERARAERLLAAVVNLEVPCAHCGDPIRLYADGWEHGADSDPPFDHEAEPGTPPPPVTTPDPDPDFAPCGELSVVSPSRCARSQGHQGEHDTGNGIQWGGAPNPTRLEALRASVIEWQRASKLQRGGCSVSAIAVAKAAEALVDATPAPAPAAGGDTWTADEVADAKARGAKYDVLMGAEATPGPTVAVGAEDRLALGRSCFLAAYPGDEVGWENISGGLRGLWMRAGVACFILGAEAALAAVMSAPAGTIRGACEVARASLKVEATPAAGPGEVVSVDEAHEARRSEVATTVGSPALSWSAAMDGVKALKAERDSLEAALAAERKAHGETRARINDELRHTVEQRDIATKRAEEAEAARLAHEETSNSIVRRLREERDAARARLAEVEASFVRMRKQRDEAEDKANALAERLGWVVAGVTPLVSSCRSFKDSGRSFPVAWLDVLPTAEAALADAPAAPVPSREVAAEPARGCPVVPPCPIDDYRLEALREERHGELAPTPEEMARVTVWVADVGKLMVDAVEQLGGGR